MAKDYTVRVNDPPTIYPIGYFPRKFKYRAEAHKAAAEAVNNGATLARIEYPNGGEYDVRPQKE